MYQKALTDILPRGRCERHTFREMIKILRNGNQKTPAFPPPSSIRATLLTRSARCSKRVQAAEQDELQDVASVRGQQGQDEDADDGGE